MLQTTPSAKASPDSVKPWIVGEVLFGPSDSKLRRFFNKLIPELDATTGPRLRLIPVGNPKKAGPKFTANAIHGSMQTTKGALHQQWKQDKRARGGRSSHQQQETEKGLVEFGLAWSDLPLIVFRPDVSAPPIVLRIPERIVKTDAGRREFERIIRDGFSEKIVTEIVTAIQPITWATVHESWYRHCSELEAALRCFSPHVIAPRYLQVLSQRLQKFREGPALPLADVAERVFQAAYGLAFEVPLLSHDRPPISTGASAIDKILALERWCLDHAHSEPIWSGNGNAVRELEARLARFWEQVKAATDQAAEQAAARPTASFPWEDGRQNELTEAETNLLRALDGNSLSISELATKSGYSEAALKKKGRTGFSRLRQWRWILRRGLRGGFYRADRPPRDLIATTGSGAALGDPQ